MSWTAFLDAAPEAGHAVQIYDDVAELSRSVVHFLDAGFHAGEPALVIAAEGHWNNFANGLEKRGWDLGRLRQHGLLTCRDASRMLDGFMDGDGASPERFEQGVGGAVDEVAARFPDRTIRAFGEMVDLLWRRGRRSAALAVEQLWSALAHSRRFSLLCAYDLDIFELEVQTRALPEILRAHTHLRPVADTGRLSAAVDKALAEVVGTNRAGQIYLRVAEDVPRTELVRAEAVLMWLSKEDRSVATEVLDRARTHYLGGRATPTASV